MNEEVITKETLQSGYKADEGKVRFNSIPPKELYEVAELYTLGGNKYSDGNYLKGMKYSRILSALFRHLLKWMAGEQYDKVDGQSHLASVIWCGFTLLYYENNPDKYKEFDDRLFKDSNGIE